MAYSLSHFHLLKRLTLQLLEWLVLKSSTSANLISNANRHFTCSHRSREIFDFIPMSLKGFFAPFIS